jgi:hypothetical protein
MFEGHGGIRHELLTDPVDVQPVASNFSDNSALALRISTSCRRAHAQLRRGTWR